MFRSPPDLHKQQLLCGWTQCAVILLYFLNRRSSDSACFWGVTGWGGQEGHETVSKQTSASDRRFTSNTHTLDESCIPAKMPEAVSVHTATHPDSHNLPLVCSVAPVSGQAGLHKDPRRLLTSSLSLSYTKISIIWFSCAALNQEGNISIINVSVLQRPTFPVTADQTFRVLSSEPLTIRSPLNWRHVITWSSWPFSTCSETEEFLTLRDCLHSSQWSFSHIHP